MTTKCRVCGNEHSGGCAEFFASQQPVANKVVANAKRPGDRHAKSEARKEYQRNLMRERRAKARAK